MAIAFVQAGFAEDGTGTLFSTFPTTTGSATSGGSFRAVYVSYFHATAVTVTVSDGVNTYTPIDTGTDPSLSLFVTFYAKNVAAAGSGQTITVTFSVPSAFPVISFAEYTGIDTSAPLDVHAATDGSGAALSVSTGATSVASELVVGFMYCESNSGMTAGSGFTSRTIATQSEQMIEDKIVSSTGTQTATATASSGDWNAMVATFKAAATGPVLGWLETSFPDSVARPTFPGNEQRAATSARLPERNSPSASAIFPDRVDRPFLATASTFATPAIASLPIRPTFVAGWRTTVWPDRIDRPTLPLAEQMVSPPARPPERSAPVTDTRFPDRVDRPSLATASHFATQDHWPVPITATLVPGWGTSVWPDRVPGLSLGSVYQVASTENAPAPERSTTFLATAYPDRVERPTLRTSAVPWETHPPDPDRPAPLSTATFPDRVDRPFLATADQMGPVALPSEPERKSPMATATFPDRTIAPATILPAAQRSIAFAPYPLAPPTLQWSSDYPDIVRGLTLAPSERPFFAAPVAPGLSAPTFLATSYPDSFFRPSLGTSWQLFATEIPPAPERSSPLPSTSYPDSVSRPSLGVSSQETPAALLPIPLSLAWVDGIFPDTIMRPVLPTALHMQGSIGGFSSTFNTIVLGWCTVSFPDSVRGLSLSPAEQQAFTSSPEPERKAPLAATTFPERVLRPTLPIPEAQTFTVSEAIERTALLVSTTYPDSISRPMLGVPWQTFQTSISPAPELNIPLAWGPKYPDRAPGLSLLTNAQMAPASLLPVPLSLAWVDGIFPDFVTKLWILSAEQMTFATSRVIEREVPMAIAAFPDRVDRPVLHVSLHLPATPPGKPDRPAPLAWTFWPDSVSRPTLLVSQQLAVTEITPLPQPVPYGWVPTFPEKIQRLMPWIYPFISGPPTVVPSNILGGVIATLTVAPVVEASLVVVNSVDVQ